MATYVFENVDNELFAQFKKFADSLGVGFQVIDKAEKNKPIQALTHSKKPTTLTEALLALPTIDTPDGEDIFARVESTSMRDLAWLD